MKLTNEQIETLLDDAGGIEDGKWATDVPKAFVRSIESAVLERLTKVDVERMAWVKEGEALMNRLESGGMGVLCSIAFQIGGWWAERPWKLAK